jgi:hypothetical protein
LHTHGDSVHWLRRLTRPGVRDSVISRRPSEPSRIVSTYVDHARYPNGRSQSPRLRRLFRFGLAILQRLAAAWQSRYMWRAPGSRGIPGIDQATIFV